MHYQVFGIVRPTVSVGYAAAHVGAFGPTAARAENLQSPLQGLANNDRKGFAG